MVEPNAGVVAAGRQPTQNQRGTENATPLRRAAVVLAILNALVLPALAVALWLVGAGGSLARVWQRFQEGGFGMFLLVAQMLLCSVAVAGVGIWNARSRRGWVAPVAMCALLPAVTGLALEQLGAQRALVAVGGASVDVG